MRWFRQLLLLVALVVQHIAVHGQVPLFDHFTSADGLIGNRINDVLQGPDGNIWLATDVGVLRLMGFDFEFFEVEPGQEIEGLYLDPARKLWCWTSAAHLYFYDNGFKPIDQNRLLAQMVRDGDINTIANGSELLVATASDGQLYQVGPGNEVSAVLQEPSNFSYFIRELSAGDFVWGGNKLEKPNDLMQVFLTMGSSAVTLSTEGDFSHSSLIKNPDESLVFAKQHELVHFNSTGVLARMFMEKEVLCLLRDSRGQLWVGLRNGGAKCFVSGDISNRPVTNYLGERTITSIAEDQAGNLWFGTQSDGMFFLQSGPQINYAPPAKFTSTNTTEVEVVEGAASDLGNENAPPQGDLRFMVTETARYDTLPPEIFITGMRIMNHSVEPKDSFALKYDENFLKFSYAGVAFSHPELLQYSYRLYGLDDEWTFTNQTEVQYTNLPPGNYTFRVRTMNKDGFWSEQDATTHIVIEQPFWKSKWFIALVSVAVFLVVLIAMLLSVQQVKRKEREKVAINKKIAEVELQALRAQMNPHFFFNTLSSIQHYITINDNDSALKYLSKFAKLMRRIMDNSRKGVINIREELEALELYLELEALRFKGKFTYRFEVDKSIDKNYDTIPAMLIQPYVENAILHGILYKEGPGEIVISLTRQNDIIMAAVEDNGVGRAKAREIKESKNPTHRSRGMDITRQRLEILNATNNSKLNVNIIDLKNDANEATGTRVEIFVPAGDK